MSTRLWICRALAAALALGVLGVGVVPHASAQRDPAIRVNVLVVLARETGGTIDPTLRGEAALRRPPFNAFQSMQVLSRPSALLSTRAPVMVDLPNGRRLQVRLLQRLPNGQLRVQVSINRPGQRDYLPVMTVDASPGDPFFVAGQSHAGGTLIIGVRVGERTVRAVIPAGGPHGQANPAAAQQGRPGGVQVQVQVNPQAQPVMPGTPIVQPPPPPSSRPGVRVRAGVRTTVPLKRPQK